MLLQIHDELIFEVPTDQLRPLAKLVTEEMVRACTLNVPLKVDIKAGPIGPQRRKWLVASGQWSVNTGGCLQLTADH